jgi:hypothetical protein
MTKALQNVANAAQRLWTRFNDFLTARAERQVDAWGASLQYKRRYTNPEVAKAYRQVP